MTAFFRSALLLAGVLALTGCGEKKQDQVLRVTVKGKLLENGKPFVFDPAKVKLPPGTSTPPAVGGGGGAIQMSLYPVEGTDVSFAKVDGTVGTFEVPAIKPGRYKIALTLGSLPPGSVDPFGGKFTQERTKIVRDIKEGEEIVIDIAKPTG